MQNALVERAIPEETDVGAIGPEHLGRECRPGCDAHSPADDAVGAQDATVDVGDVHAAALAAAVTGRLTK